MLGKIWSALTHLGESIEDLANAVADLADGIRIIRGRLHLQPEERGELPAPPTEEEKPKNGRKVKV